jgi:RNA polymerase sigma-70 factor (ECF subfamily)
MKKQNINQSEVTILRKKAEELLKKKSSKTSSFYTEADTLKLIHEFDYLKHLKVTEKYQKFQAYCKSEVDLNIYALADESAQLIISEELEAKILKVIDTLPPACKKVFELSRMEEKKYGEIAEYLGIAAKTVENQIHKALKILRKELKDYLPFLIFINFF